MRALTGGAALAAAMLLSLAGCGPLEPSDEYAFQVTYRALPVEGRTPTPEDLQIIRKIVQLRLEATGLAALQVTAQDPDLIVVEASPASALDDIRALAGATGRLDFVPLGDIPMEVGQVVDLEQHPPLFSANQVTSAAIGADQSGLRTVDFVLGEEGKRLLADYTSDHVGEHFAVVMDGQVIMAPVIQEAITGGQVQISQAGQDGYPLAEAQNLVTILKFGQHPFPLQEIAVRQH